MTEQQKNKCRSILVVEDEKGIQEVLKIALKMEGYDVFTADNGKIGLEMLQKIPRPCLILLDLMMPVMNGWQFAEVISKDVTLSSIPVVIVTAYGDRAKTVPSKGILNKPIELDSLLNTIKKWCDGIPK